MDGPLDGILMVCGLFSPWRLDYSFFFFWCSFHRSRLFRHRYQSYWKHVFWTRCILLYHHSITTKHIVIDLELTDAIKEDWGGKPFVDTIRGWKYALEKYPEVCGDILISLLSSLIYGFRLILIELWLRARVGEGMLSSQSLPLSLSLSLYSVH